ncbi:hypothetical protein CMQ_2394 [Grosmannia clavigera kw1407]|uniref:Uncharacterized protein n=1 Tax=Grosmannia clavigera (strain kw1407 / UAMH 11150) TaxID=655863 RepID=F0XJV2_GROCL|nr:uncharacterized protein CMQ_2394 [Grosmannia clavigera kw1407]EFX02345.1 hypothetical protein CMQ_2394 [Grosmannia clavigera kw1407]
MSQARHRLECVHAHGFLSSAGTQQTWREKKEEKPSPLVEMTRQTGKMHNKQDVSRGRRRDREITTSRACCLTVLSLPLTRISSLHRPQGDKHVVERTQRRRQIPAQRRAWP